MGPGVDRARIWGVVALNGSFHVGTDFLDVPGWRNVPMSELGLLK